MFLNFHLDPRSRLRAGAVLIAATVLGTACSDASDTVAGPGASYTIELGTAAAQLTVVQDSTVVVDAAVTANGDTIPNASITFTSLSPQFVKVAGQTITGLRGTAAGEPALVVASFQDLNNHAQLTDTVAVTVTANPLAGISLSLSADSVTPANTVYRGESRPLDALLRDADGDTLYCTRCSALVARAGDSLQRVVRAVRFSTPDDSIASVSDNGVLTVKDVSAANAGNISVIFESPGDSGAVARYADTLTLAIGIRPAARILVSPNPGAVAVGSTLELAARPVGLGSASIVDEVERPLTWSSSDPAIASVDSNGTVTGKSAGTVTISVQTEAVPGSGTIVWGTMTLLVQ